MSARKPTRSRASRSAAAGSWLALLAATTLGDAADTVRAEVRADGLGLAADGVFRLVVQSYDAGHGAVPDSTARPVGSVQRAVTADELRSGVQVSLIEFPQFSQSSRSSQISPSSRGRATEGDRPMVVAWIEPGAPNLEFDGRTARPGPGSVFGSVKRQAGREVQISLTRKLDA